MSNSSSKSIFENIPDSKLNISHSKKSVNSDNITNSKKSVRNKKGDNKIKKKMLIVFDIDETLIQYIGSKDFNKFEIVMDKIDKDLYEVFQDKNGKKSCVLFRPYLKDVINMIKNDKDHFYVPAIWTYSDREYAYFIAECLSKKFDFKFNYNPNIEETYSKENNFFQFIYGVEDIETDDYPKNLHSVYKRFPEFNTFNTILVDDRYANMNHEKNYNNGLFIDGFTPFGAFKKREEFNIEKMNDDTFQHLLHILKVIKKDIMGCSKEEYLESLDDPKDSVFCEKRTKRMKLDKYFKTFCTSVKKRIFLGETPFSTADFVYIKNYDEIASKKHGGKTKKKKQQRRKTVKKG